MSEIACVRRRSVSVTGREEVRAEGRGKKRENARMWNAQYMWRVGKGILGCLRCVVARQIFLLRWNVRPVQPLGKPRVLSLEDVLCRLTIITFVFVIVFVFIMVAFVVIAIAIVRTFVL